GLLPSAEPSPPSSHTPADAPACRQAAGVVFSGKWQATTWPGASSSRGGGTVRHTSCAFQHLVWNRQAGGGVSALGTSPVSPPPPRRCRSPSSERAAGSGSGTADSSATV